ncbi:MAG: hypothetical protein LBL66_06205 [Clostridiales bacterium]|nr:hypothetical protein [Clostridiales bacterium]
MTAADGIRIDEDCEKRPVLSLIVEALNRRRDVTITWADGDVNTAAPVVTVMVNGKD